jgi:hypothetical protein
MTRKLWLGIAIAFGGFISQAQINPVYTTVVPGINEHLDGSATDGGGSGMLNTPGRLQVVYDASQFPVGVFTIHELRMRPSAVRGGAFTATISNLQINLSTTAAQPNWLSATFAQNVGTNETIVLRGPITISSGFTGPAGGPKDFDIIFPLTTPFTYDSTQGNLLLDIRNSSGSTTAAFVDTGGALDDGASRAYAFSSDVARDKAAEVVQLVYTLQPSLTPWIIAQPQSHSVATAETTILSVGASGSPFLNYQWRFNGNNIIGATASSLTLDNVQSANAGEYSVVVSNTSGSITSQVAVLSVINGALLVVPSINEHLDGSATDGGGSGTLNTPGRLQVVYNASQFPVGILTIHELRMRPSAVWGRAFTATISNLQINLSTTAAQPNQLSATFAQNVGTDDTIVLQGPITVSSRFIGPPGGPKEFEIILPLSRPFNYDPTKGNLLLDIRNSSASTAAFVDTGGRLDDGASRAYAFSSDATNAVARDKAADVLQLVYTIDDSPPWIIAQPQSRIVAAGETLTLSVSVNGSLPLNYQWQFNGGNITGAIESSLTLSNLQPANAGEYSVVVSNTLGSVTSQVAVLTVVDGSVLIVPSINTNLDGSATDGGGSATLSTPGRLQVVYSASQFPVGILTIPELRMRSSAVWGRAFTATISNLQINLSTTAAQPDQLSATFAQNVGTNDTIVFQGPITISSRFTGPPGGPKDFDIIFPLTTPFTYDPRRGNLLLDIRNLSGSSAAFVDLGGRSDDGASRAYAFSSDATNAVARDKAADVLQLVYVLGSLLAPSITTQPQSRTVATGETVILRAGVIGKFPLNYQWRFNGSNITGATAFSLSLSNVQSANAGEYSVVVSNTLGSVMSQVAVLTVINGSVLVVPSINEHLDGSATDGGGSGTLSNPGRLQVVYDASQFPVGIFSIHELRMRPSAVGGRAFTATISNLQINLSTTLARANQLSGTFAQNVGADDTIVLQGPIAVASRFSGPAGGPMDFDIVFPLTTPFTYDPGRGNLLLDIRNLFGSTAPLVDVGGRLDDGASRAYAFWSDETRAYASDKAADVLQLVYTLDALTPSIAIQPQSRRVTPGERVTFSVGAGGNLPLDYQWRFNGSSIAGATASSFTLSNVQSANAGEYSVVVSNPSGSVTSQPAVLTVIDGSVLVVPSVNEHLDGSATDGGGSGTLRNPSRIQLIYDASQFPARILTVHELRMRPSALWGRAFTATIPNLQINLSTTAVRPNQLSATFAQNVGANDTIVLQGPITVSSGFVGPPGGPKEFDIIFPLSTPFAYDPSWGNLLLDIRNLFGSTAAFVDVGGLLNDGASRAYAFSSGATTAAARDKAADVFQLVYTLDALPPWITMQPQSRWVMVGEKVTFSVRAGSSLRLNYQWRFNGNYITGATASLLTLANVQSADAGEYSVVVSNPFGSVTSQVAVLSIGDASRLVIPPGLETRNGLGGTGTLDTSQRIQEVYEASMFPTYPIEILEIRFRPNISLGHAFTTVVPNIQVRLSTTQREADALSTSFAQNIGEDETTVFSGALNLSSSFSGPASGPKNFDVIVPLTTPFVYDPAAGNLLLDSSNFSGSGAAKMDGEGSTLDGASRLISLDVNGVSGNRDSAADVLQVIYHVASLSPPSILAQPESQSARAGETVTLNVIAIGGAPLTYQWRFNGRDIDGATSPSLTINGVQFSQAGVYSVTVNNPSGSAISSNAVLTVKPQADYDLSRDFSLASNPNDVWSYGWEGTIGGNFNLLPSSRTVNAANGVPVQIRSLTANTAPAVFHNATTSTATSDGGQGIFPPGTTWFLAGENGAQQNFGVIRFTVPADKEGVYRVESAVVPYLDEPPGNDTDYHVLRNNVELFGQAVALRGSSGYSNNLALAAGDTIDFVIGRGLDHYNSGLKIRVTLNLVSTNPVPPTIVVQPQSQTVDVGTTVSLGVGVKGSLPLGYRWQFNGADLPAGLNSTLTWEMIQTSQAGDYRVIVNNAYGSVTSAVATVTVQSSGVAPTVSSHPMGGLVLAGSTVTLNVAAVGAVPLSYQWFYNGSSITGATSSSLVLPNILTSQSGSYWAVVSNDFGRATSRAAALSVVESFAGGTVRFSTGTNSIYDVDGATPLPAGSAYLAQLYAGPDAGSLQPVGAAVGFSSPGRFNAGTRIIVSVPAGEVATVQVKAWESVYGATYEQALAADGKHGTSAVFTVTTGGAGSPPSLPATLTGLQSFSLMPAAGATPPTIATQPSSQSVLLGQNASFSVTATGLAPLLYRWRFNGAEVPGGTDTSLNLTNVSDANAGTYTVVVRNNGGAVTSAVATLTVETQRLLITENPGAAAEGDSVSVPINLVSHGEVSGMTFVLRYNPDYLSSPQVNWGSVLEEALREATQTDLGELRLVFALGNGTVPAGTQSLATVNLRARTIIESVESQLALQILDISGASGNPILYGSAAQPGSVAIVPTSSFPGDNNANGRLDVGDATLVLRLLALLDTTRPWDVSRNDLNHNGVLDSGDAVKILRAAAGIETPGGAPAVSGEDLSISAAGVSASAIVAGRATLVPWALLGNPGSLVTVQVRLEGVEIPIAGVSFTVNYPANILRLRGAQDHRAGVIVPQSATPVWNVAPDQNDYSTQSGQLRFAVGTSSAWSANNGILADLTFQVQNPPAGQFAWPITLGNVEITPDGYELGTLASTGATFSTRPQLGGVTRIESGTFTLGFNAGTGGSFVIEASTNLVNWVVLTNVANASGPVQITDSGASQFPQRFYRLRIP